MIRAAKKFLIAHHADNKVPGILGLWSVVFLGFLAVFLAGISVGAEKILNKTVLGAQIRTTELTDLANQYRSSQGIPVLKRNPTLDLAAQMKVVDMFEKGYFAHVSPEGLTPWFWIQKSGYRFEKAGENLAMNFTNEQDLETAWVNSEGHRKNLENEEYTEVGISALAGTYQGKPTIFVAEIFATPKQQARVVEATQSIHLPKTIEKTSSVVIATTSASSAPPETSAMVLGAETVNTEPVRLTWYQEVLTKTHSTVELVLVLLVGLVMFSMFTILFIEYKRHHFKHLMLGVVVSLFYWVLIYFL